MEDQRIGAVVRTLRRRRGWRQADLASRAGVSQASVSKLERGQIQHLRLETIRRICRALDMSISLEPRWRGSDLDRLLDAEHAMLVEECVRRLRAEGWEPLVEYSFNHFGDRGSVDVVAWHAARRALLIVEVKSRIVDLQALTGSIDRKVRVVPALLARDRLWRAAHLGVVLVIAETTANRQQVRRHPATFGAAFPAGTIEVRRWLRSPDGSLRGTWFLRPSSQRTDMRRPGGPRRVRVPRASSTDARPSVGRSSPST
jgi:transcriptional regulator with XRE-family HTH domain